LVATSARPGCAINALAATISAATDDAIRVVRLSMWTPEIMIAALCIPTQNDALGANSSAISAGVGR
jgi:hypothetical protein